MPSKNSDDQKLADQANELYWRSGQSVNQIAESMDLSKGGLYALIRPLRAGGACPECGDELVFPNRTAEQRAMGSCVGCQFVGQFVGEIVGEHRGEASESGSQARRKKKPAVRRRAAEARTDGEAVSGLEAGLGDTTPRKSGVGRTWKSSRTLWGSVLLGVAAGLYITRRSR